MHLHVKMDCMLENTTIGLENVRFLRITQEVEAVPVEEALVIKGQEGECIHLIEEVKFKVEIHLGMLLEVYYGVPVTRT